MDTDETQIFDSRDNSKKRGDKFSNPGG